MMELEQKQSGSKISTNFYKSRSHQTPDQTQSELEAFEIRSAVRWSWVSTVGYMCRVSGLD